MMKLLGRGEVVQISGFLKYIKQYPYLCRSVFVGSPGEALNAEIIFNCIEEDGKIMIIKSRKF